MDLLYSFTFVFISLQAFLMKVIRKNENDIKKEVFVDFFAVTTIVAYAIAYTTTIEISIETTIAYVAIWLLWFTLHVKVKGFTDRELRTNNKKFPKYYYLTCGLSIINLLIAYGMVSGMINFN